jgi:hypothetical protein
MNPGARGQFDNIAVRITEIDRADKGVVDGSAHLAALGLPLLQHLVKDVGLDPECYVQVERVLLLELERRPRDLKKGEAGAVIHLEERVEPATLVDLERADQTKPEEILVEAACLFRVATAIGVMVQTFYHASLPLNLAA